MATSALRSARRIGRPRNTTRKNRASQATAHPSATMRYAGVLISSAWVKTNQTAGWLARLAKTTRAMRRGRLGSHRRSIAATIGVSTTTVSRNARSQRSAGMNNAAPRAKPTGSRHARSDPRAAGHTALDAWDPAAQIWCRRRRLARIVANQHRRRECGRGRVRAIGRTIQVVALAALLTGCGVAPTPQGSATAPSAPSAGIASPEVPSASPSAATVPSPTRRPGATSVHDSEGFVTPIPPGAGAAWSGLEWHRLTVAQQLAHVRSVTRWSGGFVATGDLLVAGDSARSKVWVSDDGATWNPVPRDVFGPESIVVGVAPIVDGVLVFTLQGAGQGAGNPHGRERGASRDHGRVGPHRTVGRGRPIPGPTSNCHGRCSSMVRTSTGTTPRRSWPGPATASSPSCSGHTRWRSRGTVSPGRWHRSIPSRAGRQGGRHTPLSPSHPAFWPLATPGPRPWRLRRLTGAPGKPPRCRRRARSATSRRAGRD